MWRRLTGRARGPLVRDSRDTLVRWPENSGREVISEIRAY